MHGWGQWSAYSEQVLQPGEDFLVETKIQYTYRPKE